MNGTTSKPSDTWKNPYPIWITSRHNEKPDAYYRLGFCSVFEEDWSEALRYLRLSLKYYRQLRDTPDLKARVAQITNMIRGCEEKVGRQADSIPQPAPKP